MSFAFHPADWVLLSPELFLTAGGLLMLVLAAAFGKKKEEFLAFLSVLVLGVTVALGRRVVPLIYAAIGLVLVSVNQTVKDVRRSHAARSSAPVSSNAAASDLPG